MGCGPGTTLVAGIERAAAGWLLAAGQRQPPPGKYVFMGIVLAAVVLIPVLFALRRLIDRIGRPCGFCRNMRLTALDALPPADREGILSYFRQHEAREPDTRAIRVCLQCRTVHDDFTGPELPKMAFPYAVTGKGGVPGRSRWCKVCGEPMIEYGPGRPARCPKCRTAFSWRVHERSGMRFLMPPAGAKVLPRRIDTMGPV